MIRRIQKFIIRTVGARPLWKSTFWLCIGTIFTALFLALGSLYLLQGSFDEFEALATVATTATIAVPVGTLLCSTIRYLYHSELRLAKAQEAINDQLVKLTEARHNAVTANQAKSAFLAQMSHELRTPLNAVIGFSDVIANQDALPNRLEHEQVVEYADLISNGGNRLLSLVNDLLDLSKIEAGEMKLSPDTLAAHQEIENAVSYVSTLARERRVRISFDSSGHELHFVADKRAFSQMLVNLLSNAVKFSPMDETVRINVSVTSEHAVFTVSDHGMGMSEEDQIKAVLPFAQLSNAMVATQKGTGLGLPIVKSLIEMEGGELNIASVPGEGTSASICYPIDRIIQNFMHFQQAG